MDPVFKRPHTLGYLATLGISQRRPINLINDVTPADEPVKVSLATRCQVQDKDASAEIPEKR